MINYLLKLEEFTVTILHTNVLIGFKEMVVKVLITEVVMDKWKTTYNISLNSESGDIWEDGIKEYEITNHILETIEDQEVFGWIDGTNRFGKPVKRTYMLVPN